jgi:hypothetical protein
MKKIGSALFYVGLVIAIAGFLGEKAESLPWVLRVLAPSYVGAVRGLETLQSNGSLSPGQVGFSELEGIFRAESEVRGMGTAYYFQRVDKFGTKPPAIFFGPGRIGEEVPVEVQLTTAKVGWDVAGLRERVDELKRSSLLWFSVLVFSIGLCLTVGGRIIESRATKQNSALHATGANDGTRPGG